MYIGKAGYIIFLTYYYTKNARLSSLIGFSHSYKSLEAWSGAQSMMIEMKIRQSMVEGSQSVVVRKLNVTEF
jgi:hypothetical protein